jgi:hypothetical protein
MDVCRVMDHAHRYKLSYPTLRTHPELPDTGTIFVFEAERRRFGGSSRCRLTKYTPGPPGHSVGGHYCPHTHIAARVGLDHKETYD